MDDGRSAVWMGNSLSSTVLYPSSDQKRNPCFQSDLGLESQDLAESAFNRFHLAVAQLSDHLGEHGAIHG